MPLDDPALERFRDQILAAIRDSEYRIRGEIADAISASERHVRGEIADVVAASGTRLEARIDASAAETRRHMGVVAEDLKSKIALVAEGVIVLTERHNARMEEGFDN